MSRKRSKAAPEEGVPFDAAAPSGPLDDLIADDLSEEGGTLPSEGQSPPQPELAARLRSANKKALVYEIESPGVDWQLPEEVCLVFADGSELSVKVKRLSSTRSTRVALGRLIRLALKFDRTSRAELPIRLSWLEEGATRVVAIR